MPPRKKRETYTDLPARSDPTYMKRYNEKNRARLNEYARLTRKERISIDPNYYRSRRNSDYDFNYRRINKARLTEITWSKKGVVYVSEMGVLPLTYDKFLIALAEQDYKCHICKRYLQTPHMDHDHRSGVFRGVLCAACNTGLGIYEKMKEQFDMYLHQNFSRIAA